MSLVGKLKGTGSAVKGYGSRLKENVERDMNRAGSPGQRFADAPLGITSVLPKPVQKVAGFIAPSPRKTIRDVKNVVRNPGVGTALAAGGDIASIATLPLMGAGAVKGAKTATRAGRIANAAKALPLGERIGLAARASLNPDALFHGTTRAAAQAIRKGGFKGADVFASPQVGVAAAYGEMKAARAGAAGERAAVVMIKRPARLVGLAKDSYARALTPAEATPLKGLFSRTPKATVKGRITDVVQTMKEVGGTAKIVPFPDKVGPVGRARATVMRAIDAMDPSIDSQLTDKVSKIQKDLKAARSTLAGGVAKRKSLAEMHVPKGKALPRVSPGERGAIQMPEGDAAKRVVSRANARIRGIQFQEKAGTLVDLTKNEVSGSIYSARNYGFEVNKGIMSEARKASMSKSLKGLKKLVTHPNRLPRN